MFGKTKQAIILSVKPAIVQMPGRKYPAVAVQGDTLKAWNMRISRITELAKQSGNDKLIAACDGFQSQIRGVYESYNRACREQNRGGFDEDSQA